ncbi:hypothetical protein [Streptomyces yerevanensis]|uniref:hypothetical protein n=1 Tax=Streptomyces yerevanensis TaxID=66378 RepID=UPI000526616A|nr:hypothetical protein [Streptomyces yerevanensis]
MPRIAARRGDGARLIAYGHAGIILDAEETAASPIASVQSGWSLLRFGDWHPINEPVPDGMLPASVIVSMANFERDWLLGFPPEERAQWLEDRPDTGDPPPQL